MVGAMNTHHTPPVEGWQERFRAEARAQLARQGDTIPSLAKHLGVTERWLRSRIGPSAHVAVTLEDAERIVMALGPAPQFSYITGTAEGVQTR